MDRVQQFIVSITCGAILCAIVKTFFNKSSPFFGPVNLICGIFLVILFVLPWANIRLSDYSSLLQEFELEAAAASKEGSAYYKESMKAFITEKTQAYILDKAAEADLTVDAMVYLTDSDPPYPERIMITGNASPLQRERLSRQLCQNLNIAEENLIWNCVP